MRARAASTSASVGAVRGVASVAKVKDLLQDLTDGGQGVEAPPFHLVEETPELGVAGDRSFQVHSCARARYREDLARQVLRPPGGEAAASLEVATVLLDA